VEEAPRSGTGLVVAAFVTLLGLTAVILVFQIPLVATLGICVVAFGLFLPLRQTAVLAVTAIVAAAAVLATRDLDHEGVRFGNATVGALIGVAVSWAIAQRVARLAAMRQTQDTLFAHVPDGLAMLDGQGRIVEANAGLTALVPGTALGEVLHAHLGHVLADGSACPGGCRLDAGADPSTTPVEGEWITRDGRRLAVEYTTAAVEQGTIVSLRDVTPLKQAEEDRRVVLEAAVRQGEQEAMLKMLGAPAYAELPTVPGLQFDMSSTHDAAEGGDLVHVVRLPDGRALVSVVDAVGQGVISVRDAWKVHYVSQSYVVSGTPLRDVIPRTAATLDSERDIPDASLMLAAIEPGTGLVELVGGGHPPALLIRESGATEWLEGAAAGIGAGGAAAQPVNERQLLPGDSLVFYTDGLIDATGDVISALSTLRASAAALRKRETSGWARSLFEAVRGAAQSPGTATVLLVRVADSGSLHTTAIR
jgi:PAS domain-containing protein